MSAKEPHPRALQWGSSADGYAPETHTELDLPKRDERAPFSVVLIQGDGICILILSSDLFAVWEENFDLHSQRSEYICNIIYCCFSPGTTHTSRNAQGSGNPPTSSTSMTLSYYFSVSLWSSHSVWTLEEEEGRAIYTSFHILFTLCFMFLTRQYLFVCLSCLLSC